MGGHWISDGSRCDFPIFLGFAFNSASFRMGGIGFWVVSDGFCWFSWNSHEILDPRLDSQGSSPRAPTWKGIWIRFPPSIPCPASQMEKARFSIFFFDLEFRVSGFRFSGFRAEGFRFQVFWVQGLGFQVSGFLGLELRVSGFRPDAPKNQVSQENVRSRPEKSKPRAPKKWRKNSECQKGARFSEDFLFSVNTRKTPFSQIYYTFGRLKWVVDSNPERNDFS